MKDSTTWTRMNSPTLEKYLCSQYIPKKKLEIPRGGSALGCSQTGCWKTEQVLAGSLLFWEIQTHLLHWIWISSNSLAYSTSSWEYPCHMCSLSSPAIQREQKEKECILSFIKSPQSSPLYELLLWSLDVWELRLKPGYNVRHQGNVWCLPPYQKGNSIFSTDFKAKHIFSFFLLFSSVAMESTAPEQYIFVPAVCPALTLETYI